MSGFGLAWLHVISASGARHKRLAGGNTEGEATAKNPDIAPTTSSITHSTLNRQPLESHETQGSP